MNKARLLLDLYDGNPLAPTDIDDSMRMTFVALAKTLDAYNNGYIGPGHCDD